MCSHDALSSIHFNLIYNMTTFREKNDPTTGFESMYKDRIIGCMLLHSSFSLISLDEKCDLYSYVNPG